MMCGYLVQVTVSESFFLFTLESGRTRFSCSCGCSSRIFWTYRS